MHRKLLELNSGKLSRSVAALPAGVRSLPWSPGSEVLFPLTSRCDQLGHQAWPSGACRAIRFPSGSPPSISFQADFHHDACRSLPYGQCDPGARDGCRARRPIPGHPGLPMGAADVATVLFTQFLKFDAAEPKWPDRDRFVLSAGHGSMLLYALLYLTGNTDMTLDQIKRFRQVGFADPGPSGKFPHQRASRPPPARSARASRPRSAWRWRKRCSPPSTARRSSTTTPMCWPPTAT